MIEIRLGSLVRWADAVRDRPAARVSSKELFVVKRVNTNERCDLVDSRGTERFHVPVRALQLYEFWAGSSLRTLSSERISRQPFANRLTADPQHVA